MTSTHESRVAIVIGNSAYKHAGTLRNPVNDARAMSRTLSRLGFEVIHGMNLGHRDIGDALGQFEDRLRDRPDVALLYYAGHAFQVDGRNYLVPVDVEITQKSHLSRAILLSDILDEMALSASASLLFLDACRDNPFVDNIVRSMGQSARSVGVRGGLAPMEQAGSFIAYATAPDQVAFDGAGENSPFTSALLDLIDTPGLSVSDLMIDVRNKVISATRGKQQPWDQSSLRTRFYFVPTSSADKGPSDGSKPESARPAVVVGDARGTARAGRLAIVTVAGLLTAGALGFAVLKSQGNKPETDTAEVAAVTAPRAQPARSTNPSTIPEKISLERSPSESGSGAKGAGKPETDPSSSEEGVPLKQVPAETTPLQRSDTKAHGRPAQFGPNDPIQHMAVSPSGTRVALSAYVQGVDSIEVWNIETGSLERRLFKGKWSTRKLVWGANDDTLQVYAQTPRGNVLTQFHVASGEQKQILKLDTDARLLFGVDGNLEGGVYSSESYPSIVKNGLLKRSSRSSIWRPYRVDAFGFFAPRDGRKIPIEERAMEHAQRCVSSTTDIVYIARRHLVVWLGSTGCLLVWNLARAKPVRIIKDTDLGRPTVAAPSADGRLLAIGTEEGAVHIWDIEGWKEIRRIQASSGSINRVVFSPDGRYVVSTGGFDGAARVWDALTGKKDGEHLHLANNSLGPLGITPDGATLLTTGYHVKRWSMPD